MLCNELLLFNVDIFTRLLGGPDGDADPDEVFVFAVDALVFTFFFGVDTQNSFLGVHGSGQDRSGDIFCWTIGGNPQSAAILATLAQNLIDAGRDCVGEYANQRAFVDQIIPGFINRLPAAAKRHRTDDTLLEAAVAELRRR